MQSDNDSHVSMNGIIDFMVPNIINFIVSRFFIIISVFHYHIVSTDLIWPIIIINYFSGKNDTHSNSHPLYNILCFINVHTKRHTKCVSNHRVV